MGHAKAILSVEDPQIQIEIANMIIKKIVVCKAD